VCCGETSPVVEVSNLCVVVHNDGFNVEPLLPPEMLSIPPSPLQILRKNEGESDVEETHESPLGLDPGFTTSCASPRAPNVSPLFC
jgi:hypothetical protein